MVKVMNEVTVYEMDGKETPAIGGSPLCVDSHWNRSEMVVLHFPDGTKITVLAKELAAAISNATNTARFF